MIQQIKNLYKIINDAQNEYDEQEEILTQILEEKTQDAEQQLEDIARKYEDIAKKIFTKDDNINQQYLITKYDDVGIFVAYKGYDDDMRIPRKYITWEQIQQYIDDNALSPYQIINKLNQKCINVNAEYEKKEKELNKQQKQALEQIIQDNENIQKEYEQLFKQYKTYIENILYKMFPQINNLSTLKFHGANQIGIDVYTGWTYVTITWEDIMQQIENAQSPSQ